MAKKKVVKVELEFDAHGAVRRIRGADGRFIALSKSANKADRSVRQLSESMKLGLVAALVGVTAAARSGIQALNESAKLARIQEIAENKLAAGLRNVGDASEEKQLMLQKLASEVQRYSNFGDESIITAQAMLTTFGLTADQIAVLTPRLADMAAGVARANGETVDLNQVAQSMGKAIVDGASALKRYGVSLSKAQEEALKTAQGMERVRLVAEVLDGNFRGMAAATRDHGVAASNAIGDLREQIGHAVNNELAQLASKTEELATDNQTVAFAQQTGEAIASVIKGAISLFGWLGKLSAATRATIRLMVAGWRKTQIEVGESVNAIRDAVASTAEALGFEGMAARIRENMRETELLNAVRKAQLKGEIELIAQIWNGNKALEARNKIIKKEPALTFPSNQISAPSKESPSNKEKKDPLDLLKKERDELIKKGEVTQHLISLTKQIEAIEKQRALTREASKISSIEAAEIEVNNSQRIIDAHMNQTEAELDNIARKIAANKELLDLKRIQQQAEKEFALQQIASVDFSIRTSRDLANASIDSVRQVSQAKIAELIVNALPPVPFPLNAILWPIAGATTNALLNNLIPQFADGVTGFSGGLALVGERGPELVSLPGNSNVVTNENTEKLISAISGPSSAQNDFSPLLKELQAVRESNAEMMEAIAARPVIAHMDTRQADRELRRFEARKRGN